MMSTQDDSRSDGSTASYYQLPKGASELQHLISYRDMNAQAEVERLERYGEQDMQSKAKREAERVLTSREDD